MAAGSAGYGGSMRRPVLLVGSLAIAGALLGWAVRQRTRERRGAAGDVVPPSAKRREELVETALDGSFPASDPPAYWGRELEG